VLRVASYPPPLRSLARVATRRSLSFVRSARAPNELIDVKHKMPCHVIATRKLEIRVTSGSNLVNLDVVGKSDPYVKVELLDAKGVVLGTKKSPVVKDNLNPVWNFDANFNDVIATPAGRTATTVAFNVWDQDVGRDEYIGGYRLALPSSACANAALAPVLTGNKKKPDNSGTLMITYTYAP